jgi:glutamine synthetase
MNTIAAESLDYCATKLEEATKGDPSALHGAVQKLLSEIINECGAIIFNGDGYSDAWHKEAAARGLLNMKSSADALPYLHKPEIRELFKKYEVLSERELDSRMDIYLEQYCKSVSVEAKLTLEMAKTLIFPAAVRYQTELATACQALQSIGYGFDNETLDEVTTLVKALQDSVSSLKSVVSSHSAHGLVEEARYFCDKVLPAMNAVRQAADELEGLVADDLWPLPTYQEMLFIK